MKPYSNSFSSKHGSKELEYEKILLPFFIGGLRQISIQYPKICEETVCVFLILLPRMNVVSTKFFLDSI